MRTSIAFRGAAIAVAVATLASGPALSQPSSRRATNVAALLAFPGYYHTRQVILVGQVSTSDRGQIRVSDGLASLRVIFPAGAPDGNAEVRGEFWDLGRMNVADPRLARVDVAATFGIDPAGTWPRSGEVIAIMATSIRPTDVPSAPSIRSIVLNPSRYLAQKVTVTGQFAGRNLMADLPDAPARSRWDFVLRSTDAAIWITGARPKGKGFDLALDARIDTGRWLEVTGVVHEGRGLQWLEVGPDGIQLGKPLTESAPPEEQPVVRVPAAPPPEVVFSAPTQDETDVLLNSTVRIQLSRDLDASTLKAHVAVRYLDSETTERGEPTTPTADFTTEYRAANRVIEVKFRKPLERFRTVKIELGEGILGTDKQPLSPWTLTFMTGGS